MRTTSTVPSPAVAFLPNVFSRQTECVETNEMSSLLISAESKFDVDAVVSDNKEDIRLTEVGRLQRRLESRNKLIDEIRKAYLRDINQCKVSISRVGIIAKKITPRVYMYYVIYSYSIDGYSA